MHAETTLQRTGNDWHTMPPGDIVDHFGSDERFGLTASEAEEHLKRYGPNVITARRGKSPLVRFLLQFHNPLLYIRLHQGLMVYYFHTN
jgi:cation-transporting ATPase F